MNSGITRFFQLRERGTTVQREVVAGLTTFAAMAYVLAVHPSILSAAGLDRAELVTVTAVAAGTMSVLMGLMSNYPIAVAPQMGTNAFFAYGICLGMGIPWQGALGLVFYSGLLFILVSVTGVRQKVIELFPDHLKAAMSAGIGLFIMGVGLKTTGLLTGQQPPVFVGLGDVATWSAGLVFAGTVLAVALIVRRVPGAILISMVSVTVIGLFLPGGNGEPITNWPDSLVGTPSGIGQLWLALDLSYLWKHFGSAFPVVMTLVFIDFFSSAAAIPAICDRGGLLDENRKLPKMKEALTADGTAVCVGAMLGTSGTGVYIESAAGVEAGGRTGLTSVVVGICFFLALIFSPFLGIIPPVATAPALLLIGVFMAQSFNRIDLGSVTVAAPVVVTIIFMTMATLSDGIALGFLTYLGVELLAGQRKKLKPAHYVLGLLFAGRYLFL